MADPLFTPAVVGFAVTALLTKVIKNATSATRCRDVCKELVDRLVKIKPIIIELDQSASKTKNAKCIEWLAHFNDILVHAQAVTNDCLQESRFDKTKRVLKFWRWKKLPSLLLKINTQIDKATADTNLFTLDVVLLMNDVLSKNARESFGFVKQPTPSLIVGVEEHFNKLKTSILQSYEREYEPSTFGLQGRGGAGKTLLAQMLNNDQEIKERYGEDSIIWITVGLEANIGPLYERLGKSNILDNNVSERLKVSNMEDQRVILINAFAEKKVLLILDDVWEKQHEHHDMMYWLDVAKAPGSTVLITTRNETILCKARAEVKVVLSLNNDDSWKLFCSHAFVNEAASLTTIPEEVARAICEECKGLPLALKVIGSAMMDKTTILEWESALIDLQQSTPILDSNVDDELFGRLQLSYKELKNDVTKICFLYFAAFPEDHEIKVKGLINIWVGEELFGSNLSSKEAERKAYDHLRLLVKRSLIDWNEEEKCARIHDILRDLALYIIDNAKLGECAHECLFHSGKVPSVPRRERIVGLKRMSFINCDISHWPEDVEFGSRELRVCILQNTTLTKNRASLDFFNDMTTLRVLDLSRNSFISQRQFMSITNIKHLAKLRLSCCHSLTALPESIGNLKSLTKFKLSWCGSLTALPESIGNLKSLTEFKLSRCGSLTALPQSIGNLKSLTELDLSWCRSLTALPESIGNLESLLEFKLFECRSLTALPESIGNLKSLTHLDLSGCGSLTALPERIGNLKTLTEFKLSRCGSLTALPESIGNLESLSEFKLFECGSLTALPESIGTLKSLTQLDLSGCGSLTALPESIGNLKSLTEFKLSQCGSLTALPESIGNLKSLTEFKLFECGSLTALLESIGNLKSLTELDLSWCGSLMALPESIGNLKSLTEFKLFECGSLTALPESIGNLKSLTQLDLSGCGSLTALPESIGNLKSLTEFKLSRCGSLTALPQSIGNLKSLTELDLPWCGSLTALPESIGNLKSLTEFKLSGCGSLTALPETIGNLESLSEFKLFECGSLTALPESISNLKSLTQLDLSGCGSLTALPESIGNLKSPTEFKLSWCGSLTALPESIGNLKSLTEFKLLWCGSLTALPESIGNLKSLTKLDLSWCGSLTALPENIGNLESLTKLDLSNYGSLTALPESISNLKSLTELYLSNCGSLTALPESIDNLKSLTVHGVVLT